MRVAFLLTILLISISSFSQTKTEKTIFDQIPVGTTSKIYLNLTGHQLNAIGSFKDDLLQFEEKILKVEFDETSFVFVIVYNDEMLREDFIQVFEKYNIDYLKKKKVISQSAVE